MRLINAEALIRKFKTASPMAIDGRARQMVEEMPTIEERKKGKWINQKGGGCCCSECGRYALDEIDGNFIHVAAKSNYCPNCGADMRGEQNE